MRNPLFPLVAFLFWAGCAARPSPPPARPTLALSSRPAAEEFDPQSLHEDLLLIQPAFSPPVPPVHPEVSPPLEEGSDTSAAARPDTFPDSRTVYRVQVMALRNGGVAQERRLELERLLGVPVQVDLERGLFVVRAGTYATQEEAERLRSRISAIDPDYAGAYVVSGHSATGVRPAPPDTEQTSAVLVPVFGWRILLDQFLSHGEAERLRRDAASRLARTDIDVTFKAPWYKVELGHFRTEAEAQEFLERIKSRYPNALTVRGQIFVPVEE